jgi:intracellular sulfur oxidation DsrE/DsrF family protein
VAFNAGLHLLRSDTSPVAERIANFPSSAPNVTFSACGNTIAGMTRKEGAEPPLFEFAKVVPGGLIRLMKLNDQGYFMMHP